MINASEENKAIQKLFYHFYFLNSDVSLNIASDEHFNTCQKHSHGGNHVSQFDYNLSLDFITKNG